MQVCTSLQTDNHANTPPLSFLQAGCPSCRPTNSVKALKDYDQSLRPAKISICTPLKLYIRFMFVSETAKAEAITFLSDVQNLVKIGNELRISVRERTSQN